MQKIFRIPKKFSDSKALVGIEAERTLLIWNLILRAHHVPSAIVKFNLLSSVENYKNLWYFVDVTVIKTFLYLSQMEIFSNFHKNIPLRRQIYAV